MKFSAVLLLSLGLCAAAIMPASAKPQPQRLSTSPPKGSYQKTCRNIRLERDGRVLRAECKKWIGGGDPGHFMWEDTSLWLPCNKDIENRDGLLFCGPRSLRRR